MQGSHLSTALYGSRSRKVFQGCNRRQDPIHLFCRPGLLIPPLSLCQGCCKAMGQRSAGSRQCEIDILLLWNNHHSVILPRIWGLQQRASWAANHQLHQLYHTVSCARAAIPHAPSGQNGCYQDDSTVGRREIGSDHFEESHGPVYAHPICCQSDGGRSQVSPTIFSGLNMH